MAGKSSRQQQRKAEKKKKKAAERSAARKERLTTQTSSLSRPTAWPLGDAMISADPDDLGQLAVVCTRRHDTGRLAGFWAVVDPAEDGLISLDVYDGSRPGVLGQRIIDHSEDRPLLMHSAADALVSLKDAAAMRRAAGHDGLPQLIKALDLFGDVDLDEAEMPVLFGEDIEAPKPEKAPSLGTRLLRAIGLG